MNVPDFLQAIAQPAVPGRLCEAREPHFSGRYVQEAARPIGLARQRSGTVIPTIRSSHDKR